jgi:hypothetical protein
MKIPALIRRVLLRRIFTRAAAGKPEGTQAPAQSGVVPRQRLSPKALRRLAREAREAREDR